VRVYSLVPGCAEKFDALVRLRSAPLLAEFGIAVVAYGPLEDDGYDGYYLARVFADADARERQESAFYGSRAWRDELRAEVLRHIVSYRTVVVPLADARRALRAVAAMSG
jgi:hypothetical protein